MQSVQYNIDNVTHALAHGRQRYLCGNVCRVIQGPLPT
jgi:hypothetical protein